MPTIRRLKRRSEFLAAASGRRFHTERMTAQGRLRAPDETRDGVLAEGVHVGFTITKRVGHATERNRIRRRLRSAVAALGDEAPSPPLDLVLIGRRPALDAPFATLVEDLRRALRAVGKPRDRKDTAGARGQDAGDAASGASRRTGAHVPRRANPGRGRGKSRGEGTAHGSSHGSSDG